MLGPEAFSNPRDVAKEGERIYAEKYKAEFEKQFSGQFAAIDVISQEAFRAEFPEDAIRRAQDANKGGHLHLIRIGSSSAFQVGSMSGSNENMEWAL